MSVNTWGLVNTFGSPPVVTGDAAVPHATDGLFCDNQPIASVTDGLFCTAGEDEQSGGGGKMPGGYRIGFFEKDFQPYVDIEGFEPVVIKGSEVEQSSRGMGAEAERLGDALRMIEGRLLAMALDADQYRTELATEKAVRGMLERQIEMIKKVEAKRTEEEEIIAIITAVDSDV